MANVARFAMRWEQGEDGGGPQPDSVCVIHVMRPSLSAPFTVLDTRRLADVLIDWWDLGDVVPPAGEDPECNGPRHDYSDDTRLVDIHTTVIQPAELFDETITLDPPVFGFLGDAPMAPHTALPLGWLTDTSSRSGRGRIYLPAPARSRVDAAGKIKDLTGSSLADEIGPVTLCKWGRALWRAIAASRPVFADERLCVYSRKLGEPNAVTACYASDFVVTQRERIPAARTYTVRPAG